MSVFRIVAQPIGEERIEVVAEIQVDVDQCWVAVQTWTVDGAWAQAAVRRRQLEASAEAAG